MKCPSGFLAVMLFGASTAAAQSSTPAETSDSSRKWEITDNSFLVEEAFNQEPGIFQNIFTWVRGRDGDWDASFTQEWPAPGMTHQLSYTVPFSGAGGLRGFGDAFLNYRYQLTEEGPGRPAISPRASVILPIGRERDGFGDGVVGLQLNLPASKQLGDLYVHANAGWTWLPDRSSVAHVAGSGIWRMTPMFNLMLEAVVAFDESATLSPGFRRGWNIGEKQLVIGAAVPLTRARGMTTAALLTYFSYELPFRKLH
jgi:hypothetical protein